MSLMQEMNERALELSVPLGVHLDVTYRCNERCVHCYLDHDDHGELTTVEIKDILEQLADAGTFFLTLSGGEVLMRRDFFEILEYARDLKFNVRIKTNGVMIRKPEARRMRDLGVEQVQVSIYSRRSEIHDAITKLPGSLK
jgi:MoaA/NifB/PqqE/SkfB family radical SAM enzyme